MWAPLSSGGLRANTRGVNASGPVQANDGLVLVDAAGGVRNMALPDPATVPGAIFGFKKIDASANAVNINGTSIDGAPTVQLAGQWDFIAVQSNGAAYFVLFRG